MKTLTDYTIEEFHTLGRDSLLTLLANHDRDGEYTDSHRLALGEECLNHQEALELCVYHLNEYLDDLVSFYPRG